MAVEDEPAQSSSEALEMEEYQRVDGIDQDPAAAKIDTVIAEVPGREIGADILNDFHAAKLPGERIEIALVGKAFAIDVIIAPFDTFAAPPFDRRTAVAVVARSHPSDVIGSEFSQFLQ